MSLEQILCISAGINVLLLIILRWRNNQNRVLRETVKFEEGRNLGRTMDLNAARKAHTALVAAISKHPAHFLGQRMGYWFEINAAANPEWMPSGDEVLFVFRSSKIELEEAVVPNTTEDSP